MYYFVYDSLRLGERKKGGGREIQPLSPPQVNGAKQICADVCLLPRMLTKSQLMRCHGSGTSLEAEKCQFSLGSEPLWAWLCSASDCQDAINELLNCVLRTFRNKNGSPLWTAACQTFLSLGWKKPENIKWLK